MISFLDWPSAADFDPQQTCLFCVNRQEYHGQNKNLHRTVDQSPLIYDDDENAPLDLSIKSNSVK